ncbi:MAG: hypothetical protein ACI4OA_04660 [Selenomonadaceae bacterium]
MNIKKLIAVGSAVMCIMSGTALASSVSGVVRLNVNTGLTRMEGVNQGGMGVAIGGTGGKGESRVSRVELIQKGIDFDRVPANAIDDWYQFGKQPEGIPVFIVDTDETGHYEIKDVPAGEYYMVVVAPRIGDGMADLTRTNAGYNLSKYLPNWESFAMFTGGMQSCVVREVTVADDKDVTLDHDFSGNPFAEK